MKKQILGILLLLTSLIGEELENPFLGNDNFPRGYSLVANSMPNFMHLYMKDGGMHKLTLTSKQEEAIEEVFSNKPKKMMKAAREIKELETKLVLKVVDGGKEAKDVKELLELIAQKRKEMTVEQIACLHIFKEVLTQKQYQVLREMAIEKAEDL